MIAAFVPHFMGWLILCIIAVIFCALGLAAIHWVMEGYQYDSDRFWWEQVDEE